MMTAELAEDMTLFDSPDERCEVFDAVIKACCLGDFTHLTEIAERQPKNIFRRHVEHIIELCKHNWQQFENGCKGAEHGIKGKEYGKLGGRPRKSEVHNEK